MKKNTYEIWKIKTGEIENTDRISLEYPISKPNASPSRTHTCNTLCNICLQILTMITLQLVKCYKYVRLIPSNVKYTARACVWCIIIVCAGVRKRGTEPPLYIYRGSSLRVCQRWTGFLYIHAYRSHPMHKFICIWETLKRIPKHAHDLYIIL